jgi:3-oxoacyl-[acyl-carrier-protein] synthase-3
MGDEGLTGARVAGIEYALPARKVSNQELAALHPGWQMERVVGSTGVRQRYWCGPGETALDLATTAARKLLSRLYVDPSDIDALLFCTHSPDYPLPPNACLLQDRLGLSRRVAAFDFSLACSGFIYGLYLAKALIASRAARNVLLVTGDTYSKWISHDDRATATLFGDGAAATLVVPGTGGVGRVSVGTDGSGMDKFYVPAGGARQPRETETLIPHVDPHGNRKTAEQIWMNGAGLLDFVKTEVPAHVKTLLAECETSMDDFDYVLLHQGSQLTVDYVYNVLRVPQHKRLTNIDEVGNTVSASIPILIRQGEESGTLRPGMNLLLVGFGAGLSWGACSLVL